MKHNAVEMNLANRTGFDNGSEATRYLTIKLITLRAESAFMIIEIVFHSPSLSKSVEQLNYLHYRIYTYQTRLLLFVVLIQIPRAYSCTR